MPVAPRSNSNSTGTHLLKYSSGGASLVMDSSRSNPPRCQTQSNLLFGRPHRKVQAGRREGQVLCAPPVEAFACQYL